MTWSISKLRSSMTWCQFTTGIIDRAAGSGKCLSGLFGLFEASLAVSRQVHEQHPVAGHGFEHSAIGQEPSQPGSCSAGARTFNFAG